MASVSATTGFVLASLITIGRSSVSHGQTASKVDGSSIEMSNLFANLLVSLLKLQKKF